jgi:hypothetical protein
MNFEDINRLVYPHEIRILLSHSSAGILKVVEEVDYRDITEKVTLQEGESFLLLPNTACIGITKETVTLSPGTEDSYSLFLFFVRYTCSVLTVRPVRVIGRKISFRSIGPLGSHHGKLY